MPWCREHEHQALQSHIIGEAERQRVKEDLSRRIESNPESGCWIWTGHKSGGYGIYKGRKNVGTWKAHRLAWHLWNTGTRRGQELDHTCANPLCVNPLHLLPTSGANNIQHREERRENPDLTKPGNDQRIFLPLLGFAWLNELVFRAGDDDFSASYIVSHADGCTNVANILGAYKVDPTPPAATNPPPLVKVTGISDKTLKDLKLTPEEATMLNMTRRRRRQLVSP